MFYARTNAEAHLFMDLTPCGCGDNAFERRSSVVERGDVLCSEYVGPCRTCGAIRTFVFELPEVMPRPVPGKVVYGGDDPSRLLDPGEWMTIAEHRAKLVPATTQDLAVATAAVEEILKFIPPGGDRVPETAFVSDRGKAILAKEPGRFRKSRLEAVLATYRKLLGSNP
jgi:hypothetical protein